MDSTSNILMDNYCNNNGEAGIAIKGSAFWGTGNHLISKNTVKNNLYGIYLWYTSENEIHRNFIEDNVYGFRFEGGTWNNLIFHNNIIDNTVQASDPESDGGYLDNSKWFHPYMLEGNYWSDYTGTDDDGDGIGDTPWPKMYYDCYPFMEENGWDQQTEIEQEILDVFYDPNSNRIRAGQSVNGSETIYLIYGMAQLYSEMIHATFFPPYNIVVSFYGIEIGVNVPWQGTFWAYNYFEAYGEWGYTQWYYIILPPNFFFDPPPVGMGLPPGDHPYQLTLSWHDGSIHYGIYTDAGPFDLSFILEI